MFVFWVKEFCWYGDVIVEWYWEDEGRVGRFEVWMVEEFWGKIVDWEDVWVKRYILWVIIVLYYYYY